MIILALVFTLFNLKILSEPIISISIIIIVTGCIVFFILLFNPSIVNRIELKTGSVKIIRKIISGVKNVFNDILFFRDKYRMLTLAMAYSFLFYLLTFFNVLLC